MVTLKKSIDYIVSNTFLILAILTSAMAFWLRSPELEQQFFQSTFGLNFPTGYDWPTIFIYFFILLVFVAMLDSFFISEKAYHSDLCWVAGADHNFSCIADNLKTYGNRCWLRGEGIKRFPLEGNHIVSNYGFHTHTIDHNIIMEGESVPGTELTYIPSDIKSPVRQRRGGLFGAIMCSIGYISHTELLKHRKFNNKDYKEFLEEKEIEGEMDTATFIDNVRDLNRDLNMRIEFANNERDSLSKFLNNIINVGKEYTNANKGGLLDKWVGK